MYLILGALISQKNRKSSFSFWSYPFTPFLGGLLLNWRVCLCLNLGGPLRGVVGPWFEAGGAKVVLSLILMSLGVWWFSVRFLRWWEGKKGPSGYRDRCFLDSHWKQQKSSGLCVGTKGKNLSSFKDIFKKIWYKSVEALNVVGCRLTTDRFTNQKSR